MNKGNEDLVGDRKERTDCIKEKTLSFYNGCCIWSY